MSKRASRAQTCQGNSNHEQSHSCYPEFLSSGTLSSSRPVPAPSPLTRPFVLSKGNACTRSKGTCHLYTRVRTRSSTSHKATLSAVQSRTGEVLSLSQSSCPARASLDARSIAAESFPSGLARVRMVIDAAAVAFGSDRPRKRAKLRALRLVLRARLPWLSREHVVGFTGSWLRRDL